MLLYSREEIKAADQLGNQRAETTFQILVMNSFIINDNDFLCVGLFVMTACGAPERNA